MEGKVLWLLRLLGLLGIALRSGGWGDRGVRKPTDMHTHTEKAGGSEVPKGLRSDPVRSGSKDTRPA